MKSPSFHNDNDTIDLIMQLFRNKFMRMDTKIYTLYMHYLPPSYNQQLKDNIIDFFVPLFLEPIYIIKK